MNGAPKNLSTGATGGSPAPTSGAAGSTPAPTSGSTSATTKKIDVGMGPRKESAPAGTPPSSENLYDDNWWGQHGDAIFKHDRFKELTGYKQKYSELEPVKQFVDEMGGLEDIRSFYHHLGPVWSHLVASPDAGNLWAKLAPVLQAFIANQDFPAAQPAKPVSAGSASDEDDPFAPHIKPLQDKVSRLEETLQQRDQRERQDRIAQRKETHIGNLKKYESLLDERVKAEVKSLPAEAQAQAIEAFKDFSADMIIQQIGQHMPKDQNGKFLNPLDAFSAEAFNSVWDKVVLARLRKMKGYILAGVTKSNEDGGPAIPDTSGGRTPVGKQTPVSREDKAARFAQGLRNLGA